ncbi:hypothetical protein PRIPAC_90514 [Pristionchus pacificus]|uniref:Uncharacterized protein n=1 Tax=Pristionchus pacificus TaxID=54126 RepID=A0A2A6CXH4_PRIPA|nr:hypothetical protein PRIPAC_90514 [Pristionchus pacificus]|eukprot:PDM82875.1 hypothetical protein PRIPAC_37268 [Pristionchus pacificus]
METYRSFIESFPITRRSARCRVDLFFFDEDNIGSSEKIPENIPAHLRLVKHAKYNVYSNTRFNGIWQTEIVKEQLLDEETPANGYWRVDIIKVDKYRLNVYQGFWSDARTFSLSLDNLKSFRISSLRYVNFESIQTLPGFPKDGSIDLVVLMQSCIRETKSGANPGLIFTSAEGFPFFLKIHQEWMGMSYQMYLSTTDTLNNAGHPTRAACSFDWWHPNGDLVHLKLTRIRYNVVEMRVLFKHHKPNDWYTNWETLCWMWIPSELTKQLDKPFNATTMVACYSTWTARILKFSRYNAKGRENGMRRNAPQLMPWDDQEHVAVRMAALLKLITDQNGLRQQQKKRSEEEEHSYLENNKGE